MQAITIRGGKGSADALELAQVDKPSPGPGQILIEVQAAGVNRPDIGQRLGNYPPPPGASPILGLEVAGRIAALGAEVSDGASAGAGRRRWHVGDAVKALLPGGGYAQFAVVDARHVLPIPTGLSFVEAAALPETLFTVWSNVFERAALRAGETLLIHGANSGIGVTAIQLAIAAGARVFATVRGCANLAKLRALGVAQAIDVKTTDWASEVKRAGGADVILDMIGAQYFDRNVEALKTEGRLSVIATLTGERVAVNLLQFMQKRLVLTASTLRPRDANEKARLTQSVEQGAWPWVAAGKVRPIIDKTFPLADAGRAHAWLESGSHFGKVVLTI